MIQIFISFLLASAVGSALGLVLAVMTPITRKRFSATWHYYMWLVILLVMVLPVRLDMPKAPVITTSVYETTETEEYQARNAETPVAIETLSEPMMQEHAIRQEKATGIQRVKEFLGHNALLFSIIWLVGAGFLFLIKMAGYLVFLIKIHRHAEVIFCPELAAYTNRKIRTRVSDKICSPLMIGIIRPTLLLPKTNITQEQLHYVLAHEMTHFKRHDILVKWFAGIVKCVHWFNPFIYFICKQIHIDCEISCDLEVVQGMDEKAEKTYVETILALLRQNNSKPVPLTTGMTGDKKTLKRRLMMIKHKIKVNKKTQVVSLVLAVLLCVGALFASGMLNGKLNTANSMVMAVDTDERQSDACNFLMIGVDSASRVDTILVFNFDGETLTCMNIPRHTALAVSEDVPIEDNHKTLSTLLSEENGDQKVIDSMRETLGIPIHYYAKIEMDAIIDVVDYVGGLEFDVPYHMVYDDPAQNLHIDLTTGKQVLTGEQVQHLLRYRDRIHPFNGEEIRTFTWHSVIKEFLNQVVIGNKIHNLPALYDVAMNHVKTNYPLDTLIKDFNNLKNMNRNHVIIENIRGRNVTIDGYFLFHINFVESKPLLDVFASAGDGANLVSAITYENDTMGFTIKVPERWKSKYEVIQFDNQVVFYHKDIFLKYGKGSGGLFNITKIAPPTESNLEAVAEPREYLYWGKHFAYVWSVASDVQVPVWKGSDEEDAALAEDYEDMMKDLDYIKNSFSLLEEE